MICTCLSQQENPWGLSICASTCSLHLMFPFPCHVAFILQRMDTAMAVSIFFSIPFYTPPLKPIIVWHALMREFNNQGISPHNLLLGRHFLPRQQGRDRNSTLRARPSCAARTHPEWSRVQTLNPKVEYISGIEYISDTQLLPAFVGGCLTQLYNSKT